MRNIYAVMVLLATFLASCATDRDIIPKIDTTPRLGFSLEAPVLISVYDGRTDRTDDSASKRLKSDLANIYGRNIEWTDYFANTSDGRIALRIRIVTLGASFDSRLISSSTYTSATQNTAGTATGPWGAVAINSQSNTSIMGGNFTGEGWWNGAAWVDLEVHDKRLANNTRFTVPIASENRQSNTWGYASGDIAGDKAWRSAANQLILNIDQILRIVNDTNQ